MYSSKFYLKNGQTWRMNFGKRQKSFEKGKNGARTEETTWLTLSAVQRLSQKWKSWKIFLKENIFSGDLGGKTALSPLLTPALTLFLDVSQTLATTHMASVYLAFTIQKAILSTTCVCQALKTDISSEWNICMCLQGYWFIEYSDFVKMWKGSLIAPLASVERERVILSEAS